MLVWVLIVVLLIAIVVMPKRLTLRENIIIFPSVGYFAWTAHIIVGVMLNLLDLGPTSKVEFTDWALVTFVPSLIAILFLNFKKTDKNLLYALIWIILSCLIELSFVKVGYMKYSGWKIWYSIPGYLLAYLLLPWYFKEIVRKRK